MGIRDLVRRALPRFLAPVTAAPGVGFGIGAGQGGWQNLIREPFAGAWQRNMECRPETLMSYAPVFACSTLIADDIGKLPFQLIKEADDGISKVVQSPAFSPLLRKPNHYQTRIQFIQQWQHSLNRWGNTFVLMARDFRGIVTEMYVLDPMRVTPLIATDGSVYYELGAELLADIQQSVIVPASEIIHDRINCMFHPLVGLSPMFAAALSAGLGIEIERNSASFFANGAKISGIITAPGAIGDAAAQKVSENFNKGYTKENAGKVAVLGDGLKFQQLTMNSTDAQLIEMLKKSAEDVCSVYRVPAFKVGFGVTPPYNNIEALNQEYYNECLQIRIEAMECLLSERLKTDQAGYYVQIDLSGLLRMDTAAQYGTFGKAVADGVMTPNEARAKFNLPKLEGGDTVYLQQQDFALSDLAKRSALPNPFLIDKPVTTPTPTPAGEAATVDPNAADPDTDKSITLEQFEGDFEMVVKQIAPLALPAPITKAA